MDTAGQCTAKQVINTMKRQLGTELHLVQKIYRLRNRNSIIDYINSPKCMDPELWILWDEEFDGKAFSVNMVHSA